MDDQQKNSENQTEDERATLSVPPPSFRERMQAARRAQEREAKRPATKTGEAKAVENASETLPVPPPSLKERIRAAQRARENEAKPSTNIPVPPREAEPDRSTDSPKKESAG